LCPSGLDTYGTCGFDENRFDFFIGVSTPSVHLPSNPEQWDIKLMR
jgi:hypothetical protein